MSKDDTADDTMRRYETDQDSGDASNDSQPAISPAPKGYGNDDSDAPIPMATQQSPVQTESDTAQIEDSPEVSEDGSSEVRSNKGSDKEYREV